MRKKEEQCGLEQKKEEKVKKSFRTGVKPFEVLQEGRHFEPRSILTHRLKLSVLMSILVFFFLYKNSSKFLTFWLQRSLIGVICCKLHKCFKFSGKKKNQFWGCRQIFGQNLSCFRSLFELQFSNVMVGTVLRMLLCRFLKQFFEQFYTW